MNLPLKDLGEKIPESIKSDLYELKGIRKTKDGSEWGPVDFSLGKIGNGLRELSEKILGT